MRFLLMILALLFIATRASADDFRGHSWGDALAKVRSIEGKPLDEGATGRTHLAIYNGKLLGSDVIVHFRYLDNKLVGGGYVYSEKHSNKNDYLVEYAKWGVALEEKYGKPEQDRIIWRNARYQKDPPRWGLAISMGHLVLGKTWKTAASEIGVALHGDNFKVSLGIDYGSVAFKPAVKAEEREREKGKL